MAQTSATHIYCRPDSSFSSRISSLLFPEPFFIVKFPDLKMNAVRLFSLPILGFIVLTLAQLCSGEGMAPSPSPSGPSNDGTAIDQGIAYVLLLVALAITYLVH